MMAAKPYIAISNSKNTTTSIVTGLELAFMERRFFKSIGMQVAKAVPNCSRYVNYVRIGLSGPAYLRKLNQGRC